MSETINELRNDLDKERAKLEVYVALDRLLQNEDFKNVIVKGYFNEEALRLLDNIAVDGINTEVTKKKLEAISYFKNYLVLKEMEHNAVKNRVEYYEAELQSQYGIEDSE